MDEKNVPLSMESMLFEEATNYAEGAEGSRSNPVDGFGAKC